VYAYKFVCVVICAHVAWRGNLHHISEYEMNTKSIREMIYINIFPIFLPSHLTNQPCIWLM
jgi:hypothetical protein